MKNRFILLLILVIFPLLIIAQGNYELGLLPSLNINSKLPRDWSVNFKAESRQSLKKEDFEYNYLLTDISLSLATKIRINTTIAVGYLMRIEDEGINYRTIQQISFIRRYPGISLAHRLSADQTYADNDHTEFRFRYRISTELPLKGQSTDPGEFYLKINNEYLASFQGGDNDLEIRTALFTGYVFSPAGKLEFGPEYRLDSFLSGKARNRFWIGLNFYQSI